jgi:hypothetical protein
MKLSEAIKIGIAKRPQSSLSDKNELFYVNGQTIYSDTFCAAYEGVFGTLPQLHLRFTNKYIFDALLIKFPILKYEVSFEPINERWPLWYVIAWLHLLQYKREEMLMFVEFVEHLKESKNI